MTEDALMEFKTERDIQALSDFLAAYSLSADPFSEGGAYWQCPSRQQLLDKLIHQSLFGAGLLVVSSESGAGKSRMAERLFDEFSQDGLAVLLSGQAGMDAILSQLLQQLLALEFTSQAEALKELQLFSPSEDEAILLILDDAEYLTEADLASLVSILSGSHLAALSLVLFAQPQVIGRLALIELGDLPVHDFSLPPLNELQVQDYVAFQMSQGGSESPLPFDQEEISQWWQASSGNMAELNRIASARLLALSKDKSDQLHQENRSSNFVAALQSVTSKSDVDDALTVSIPEVDHHAAIEDSDSGKTERAGLPVVHLLLLSSLLAILLLAYFYLGDEEQAPARQVQFVKIEPKRPLDDLLADIQTSSGNRSAQVPERVENSENPEEVPKQSLPAKTQEVVQNSEADLPVSVPVSTESMQTKPPVMPAKELDAKPESPSVARDTEVFLPESDKALAESVVTAELPVTPRFKPSSKLSPDEQYLLALPDGAYALQILGASTRPSIDQFLKGQKNRPQLRVYVTRRQNRIWYVVLAVEYANQAEARAAISGLPSEQRDAGPWPKPLRDVHREIREFRGI